MRAVVVYESMFGNTHVVADHIAEGLKIRFDVTVVAVADATPDTLSGVDLLVVGGPTHVHGMSSKRSRTAARDMATPSSDLILDPAAEGTGVRDWTDQLDTVDHQSAAVFDTRVDASPLLTGRASKRIAHRLRDRGCQLVAAPEPSALALLALGAAATLRRRRRN